MEQKKYCPKCGNELMMEAVFCPRCGQSFSGQPVAQPTPIEQYNMSLKPKKSITSMIDIKKTLLSNIIPVICLGVGIVLLISGLGVKIPSDYISSYSMKEYVGGDAYNFIIEACLRGGRIAGAMVTKGLNISIGLLIACMSALKVKIVKPEPEAEE